LRRDIMRNVRKYSTVSIVILCIGLLTVGFVSGLFVSNIRTTEKPNTELIKGQGENDEDDSNLVLLEEGYIAPNTKFQYITHYKECDHIVRDETHPADELIGMKEIEFRNYIQSHRPDWQLLSFGKDKVEIKIEKNHLCPNHYVIGVVEEKIAIFKINENGERVLETILKDQSILLLREADQEKLKKGIGFFFNYMSLTYSFIFTNKLTYPNFKASFISRKGMDVYRP